MPLYEYYCKPCNSQFEILRPLSKLDEPAVCPGGHTTNNRVLSLFAPIQRYGGADTATAVADSLPMAGGDACCGGGCSCC
jgi:putative FmdB family regulatory protein